VGTLASEDLTCITTGILIAQGKLSFTEGVLACLTGILSGDILLFLAGRLLGRPALTVLLSLVLFRPARWSRRRGGCPTGDSVRSCSAVSLPVCGWRPISPPAPSARDSGLSQVTS